MKTIYLSLLSIPLLSSCTSTDVQDSEDPLPCDPLAADPSDPSACELPPDPMQPGIEEIVINEATATLATDSGELTTASGKKIQLTRTMPEGALYPFIRTKNLRVPVGSTLLVSGPGPAYIVIDESIVVEGNIKVEPSRSARECGDSAGKPGAAVKLATQAAGGGGGGGRAKTGGAAGQGYGGRPGGAGGVARSGVLVSGCPGGRGGDNVNVNGGQGGTGGLGGGALLIRANRIKVTGQIMANGAGGGGGDLRGGGGGGGSGGTIYLDGSEVELGGAVPLCANGGGGGEAGLQGGPGKPGSDGRCAVAAAAGGHSPNAGGNGGVGGFRDKPSTRETDERAGHRGGNGTRSSTGLEGGGGGGGGSAGRIFVRARNKLEVQDATVTSPNFDRRQ